MSLGAKIKQLRTDKGWTQGQLATFSGVTRSYISLLESEKRTNNPGSEIIVKLAKALEVDEEVLLQAAGLKKAINKKTASAVEDFAIHLMGLQPSDEELAELKAIADALFGTNGTRRNKSTRPR